MAVGQINGVAADGFTGHVASVVDMGGGVYGLAVSSPGGSGGAITIADGADVTEGSIADAAVSTDAAGTVNAHLRGIVKLLAAGIVTNPTEKTILTVCGSANSNTSIVGAVTGKRIKCVFVSLRTSYSAGAIVPILTDGNGGTTIFQDLEQAGSSGPPSGSVNTMIPFGAATTAGTALYLNPNGQTVYYTIYYHADDAT